MKKIEILKKLVQSVEKKNPEEIQAKVQGIPNPEKISYKGANSSHVPDMVARYETKQDIYFIEEKYNKNALSEFLSKWLLFSTEARKRGGKFYLYVPEKNLKEIADVIARKQIILELKKVS
ncbi:MAG: hypothetical protein R2799_13615 [Crocinitomicaceae bacterium]